MLTVFTSEAARTPEGKVLVQAVVERAREHGLAGASILRGVEGFGHSGRLRTSRFPDIAVDLPVVIQMVDSESRIEEFLPVLEGLTGEALVVRQRVTLEHHRDG